MNIGDRVRLLHGKEQGIIKKISSSGRIEVEVEDGPAHLVEREFTQRLVGTLDPHCAALDHDLYASFTDEWPRL